MALDVDKGKLLQALRIDREQRDEPSEPRGRSGLIVGVVSACVLLAAAAAFALLRARPFEVDAAVALAPRSNSGPSAILQATGYVTARREATVSAQITGKLSAVLIEEGEQVRTGQVLARLDATAQEASLAQAQAQLMAARALLAQYQAQLEQARRDLKRNQGLIDRNLVSQQALETTQTQVETLEAQVESQRKQIELGQATLQGAQVQLDYTTVRAPFSGVIVAKAAQAGEIISPISAGGGFTRTGIGTIVDMDSLEIEVDVNEAYINRVQPQQSAQAVLDAYPDWTIPAHVIAIVPTADRSKATVKVRIAIEHKDPRILPDMGVRVSFLESAPTPDRRGADARAVGADAGASGPQGVLVPATAIVERAGHSVVFSIEGTRAHAQPVSAGQAFGDLRLVSGVASGTRVVRDVPARMEDGAPVELDKQ